VAGSAACRQLPDRVRLRQSTHCRAICAEELVHREEELEGGAAGVG